MAIKDIFKKKVGEKPVLTPEQKAGRIYIGATKPEITNSIIDQLTEQFKGESKVKLKRLRGQELNIEEHPTNFEILEAVYKQVPIAFGLVNKYVDFIMSGGIFVKSDNAQAQKIIEDFIRDTGFNSLMREWIRESLIKGWGVLELGTGDNDAIDGMKVHNTDNFFIELDDTGEIKGHIQDRGRDKEPIPFDIKEIAGLGLNKISSSHYALGVLHPLLSTINNIGLAEIDMHTVLSRKANSPIVITAGTTEMPPTKQDIDRIGEKLVWLRNKHEWVFGPDVKFDVKEFGNIGDKFLNVIEHDMQTFVWGGQMPEVLFGSGNIPEGLAEEQGAATDRVITSMQDEIEKIVESQIFRRVLQSQGIDDHVELEWGQPSNDEKNERIKTIVEILNIQSLEMGLRIALEKELATLLELEVEEAPEIERNREDEEEQPRVPGQNRPEQQMLHEEYNFELNDYSVKEWLNFNFGEYLTSILDFINEDNFDLLREKGISQAQVGQLKAVLKGGFIRGASMNEISKNIERRVRPGELKGISNALRSMRIARTEVTRTAFQGSLKEYNKEQVQKLRFVSSLGQRTCPQCESLQGKIFSIQESAGLIPVHPSCRCTMVPVVEVIQ